jgi:cell division protein FtsQ
MKKIFQIILWTCIFAGIIVILGFAVKDQKQVTCSGVSIVIRDNMHPGFINEDDISQIIQKHYEPLQGMYLDSINTGTLKATLESNPYVKEVNVYKSIPGEIRVELRRSQALVRVINKNGQGFYLGTKGEVLPTSNSYIPRTLVATGNITDSCDPGNKIVLNTPKDYHSSMTLLQQIFYLSSKILVHPVFSKSISQIYINSKGEFELMPAAGGHIIQLGNVENLDIKLENLIAFYQAGAKKLTESDYKIIDLKFNDLVVCKKLYP